MTAHHDLDRQLNAFLLDGPTSLPDSSFDAVRDRTEQTRQRVVLGPWRVPTLNKLIPIGLGAAALVAVLLLGSRFIGSPSSNVGGPASQPPASAAPSEAPASAAPASAAPSPVSPPPLTQSFTSPLHGISLSYPEGWTARAATEPWTDRPGDHPSSFTPVSTCCTTRSWPTTCSWTSSRSRSAIPRPTSGSPSRWLGDDVPGSRADRRRRRHRTDRGQRERLRPVAAVTTAGRGYRIELYRSNDDPAAVAPYDRAWFEEVLATVQLHPEDAVD